MRRDLFAVPGGWGYDIIDDADRVTVHQPFRPGTPGELMMTEAEAAAQADAVLCAPALGCDRQRVSIGDTAVLTVDIGPDNYAGPVQWFEGAGLLGEVITDNRRAVLEYAPDVEGTVAVRAGNDTYGWAEVVLEVRP